MPESADKRPNACTERLSPIRPDRVADPQARVRLTGQNPGVSEGLGDISGIWGDRQDVPQYQWNRFFFSIGVIRQSRFSPALDRIVNANANNHRMANSVGLARQGTKATFLAGISRTAFS